MTNVIKKILKIESLVAYSFYLFLVFLPFGYRHLIAQFTPNFDEYESAFIYFNDFLLVLFLALTAVYLIRRFRRGDLKIRWSWSLVFLTVFVVVGAISILFAGLKLLALYFFIRLVLVALMAVFVAILIKEKVINFEIILAVIAALAAFEGLVSFGQFYFQRSLGLKFLGESVLEYSNPIVAHIWVDGARLLRAYGTFPHSNILAAFMVIGVLSFYYFLGKDAVLKIEPIGKVEKKIIKEALAAVGLFFSSLGLILSFSRSGWLAMIFSTGFVILAGIFNNKYRKKAIFLLIILIALGLVIFSAFGWVIAPRSHLSIEEPSVYYRLDYDEVALILTENHPLGVGLGNQVITGISEGVYQKLKIDKLNWQPIHNIYLLSLVESGVLGFLAFILFICSLLWEKIKDFKNWDFKIIISFAIFLALLFLGLFDHYLWDLEPGRLMFWLAVGIMLRV
ncbi:MAG: O-antigen ligase family protein [Patescibacteria group bacterium]|nr:O-antigen ligase family protein [Patescibacteria group bacterium]